MFLCSCRLGSARNPFKPQAPQQPWNAETHSRVEVVELGLAQRKAPIVRVQLPRDKAHRFPEDFCVVLAWFVDTLAQGWLPVDPLMLRLLRLVKLPLDAWEWGLWVGGSFLAQVRVTKVLVMRVSAGHLGFSKAHFL